MALSLLIVGLVVVVAGVSMLSIPAGVILAGLGIASLGLFGDFPTRGER